MTKHLAEDWIQRQPYFNPNAPDLINKVAEATSIIRGLLAINVDLLEALRAMLREHGPIPEGLYNGGRCQCGACTFARDAIREAEEQA